MKRRFWLVLVILMPLLAACGGSTSALASAISRGLICQCGECSEVLSACDCDFAGQMMALIEQKVANGQPAERILAGMVSQYGEQVLVPTAPR
ncbi:MAG: cytochrome c-type biogenesis protein CcmH [Chloroflexota bacterium]